MPRISLKMAGALALIMAGLVLAACGGSSGQAGNPDYVPAVTPMKGDQAAQIMSIKSAAGVAPCGVFDVNGHGFKQIALADFPDCHAAKYVVLCLDAKAAWQGTYIHDLALAPDKKSLGFTSEQDGTCGLFPK